jgi:hypothetical protein
VTVIERSSNRARWEPTRWGAAIATAIAGSLLVAALVFSQIYGSSGFGIDGMLLALVPFALFALALIPALLRLCYKGPAAWIRLLPLAIWLASLWVVLEPPLVDPNFLLLRAGRENAVRMIERGELQPNDRGIVDLGAAGPMLSAGGNGAMVGTCGSKTCVLFFADRGILHHYTGYLFVPSGGNAGAFDDLLTERGTIKPLDGNWYFVGQ